MELLALPVPLERKVICWEKEAGRGITQEVVRGRGASDNNVAADAASVAKRRES